MPPIHTVLLTGARAPVALEWARQLAAAGWRVLAADSMPRPLASWSRAVERTWRVPPARWQPEAFVEAVAAVCRSEAVDLLIPTCEEIFTLAAGRGALPPGTRLWAAEAPVLETLHHKGRFIREAVVKGLPVPETRLLASPEAVKALQGDWYLKPCYSRFAQAGRRWNSDGQPARPAAHWLSRQEISRERPWVAHEYLAGAGWCSYALVEQGRVLASVAYPVEWTAGAGACVAFRAQPHPGIDAWVRQFLAGGRFSGQLAFDFIDLPGRGALPLECNPRATSGLHLRPDAAHRLTAALNAQTAPLEPMDATAARAGSCLCPCCFMGCPKPCGRGGWPHGGPAGAARPKSRRPRATDGPPGPAMPGRWHGLPLRPCDCGLDSPRRRLPTSNGMAPRKSAHHRSDRLSGGTSCRRPAGPG